MIPHRRLRQSTTARTDRYKRSATWLRCQGCCCCSCGYRQRAALSAITGCTVATARCFVCDPWKYQIPRGWLAIRRVINVTSVPIMLYLTTPRQTVHEYELGMAWRYSGKHNPIADRCSSRGLTCHRLLDGNMRKNIHGVRSNCLPCVILNVMSTEYAYLNLTSGEPHTSGYFGFLS